MTNKEKIAALNWVAKEIIELAALPIFGDSYKPTGTVRDIQYIRKQIEEKR